MKEKETCMWVSQKEASKVLKVDEHTLELLREKGYLRPGSHWRSSTEYEHFPWKPKVSYLLTGCKEVVDYWRDKDHSIKNSAA